MSQRIREMEIRRELEQKREAKREVDVVRTSSGVQRTRRDRAKEEAEQLEMEIRDLEHRLRQMTGDFRVGKRGAEGYQRGR